MPDPRAGRAGSDANDDAGAGMDIGLPKRVIEIEPASLPVPEPAPILEPDVEPLREPVEPTPEHAEPLEER